MNEKEIFQTAIEMADSAQRQAYLAQACGTDTALRARIDALLASHAAASQFLNVPALEQRQPPVSNDHHPTMELSPAPRATPPGEGRGSHDNDDDESESAGDLSFLQPPTQPGSIGTLGHYVILQVLGQGAFGIVFKAFDENLHRHVAIKAMNPQLAATSPPRKRFLREARSVAALKHENIVQVYSVEEQPLPYLVMEYVDGQTLQQKLDGAGPLEVPEILHLGRQMAAGLAAAHEKGLIHRDIKPSNILLEQGAEQTVKITDFGLARAADDVSMTRTGIISGTPMFMAPEQALGQALDHRADLFSLGSVLYQMACGRPPFRASATLAILRRVAEDSPRPMQEVLPGVPDWLVAIVAKLHAKNPAKRFQSAREVAELLNHYQSQLGHGAEVTSVPDHPQSDSRVARARLAVEVANGRGGPAAVDGPVGSAAARDDSRSVISPARRRRRAFVATGLVLASVSGVLLLCGQLFRTATNHGDRIVEENGQGHSAATTSSPDFNSEPSSFDVLRREDIPPYELAMAGGGDPSQAPPELVAVLGDSRLRHWQDVKSIVFTPDGESLITSSVDQTARIWDVATGRQKQILQTYEPANRPIWLALSQDGKTLVTITAENTQVWDLPSGKKRREIKAGSVGPVSFSKDGNLLLVLGNGCVSLVTLAPEKVTRLAEGQHRGSIGTLALSPDGSLVATGDPYGVVKLFMASDGREALVLPGLSDQVTSLAFSPDGQMLAAGGNEGLRVWEARTGKELLSIPTSRGVSLVAYSADGEHLAAGNGYGEIRIWNALTYAELPTLKVPGRPTKGRNGCTAIAFSPDGQTIAVGLRSGQIKMWDFATGKERFDFSGHQATMESLAVAPSGKMLATGSGDGTVHVVDVPSMQVGSRFEADGHPVLAVAFGGDSQLVFAGTGDGNIDNDRNRRVLGWELKTGKLEHVFERHAHDVSCMAVSPDGMTLAAGDYSSDVKIWDIRDIPTRTKQVEPRPHKSRLTLASQSGITHHLAFSPDGTTLAAGYQRSGRVWDVASGKLRSVFHDDVTGGVTNLGFSSDNLHFASAGGTFYSLDARTSIHEVTSGTETMQLPVGSFAVSFGHGNRLYTAGARGTVQIWDLTQQESKRLEKVIRLGPPGGWIEQLALTPDGRHLLTRNFNGTIYVLRVPAPTATR